MGDLVTNSLEACIAAFRKHLSVSIVVVAEAMGLLICQRLVMKLEIQNIEIEEDFGPSCASAKVVDLNKESLRFCVEKVKEAIEMVTDEYVKSVMDWLEVYRGVPSILDENFYVSAWWKLPFHELNFGYGRLTYGGPVVSGMDEFVLLLSDGIGVRRGGGDNVWMALEQEKMEKFMMHVFDM
ncbi:acyltransferase GLAUCE-like [Magnolia sinica]|uniref:acyltransferase GLAUCE-like n=1 Tax=Magnolia sinica TaxID=86752 RepID=UPI00265969A6|nr:acyltransferase GLAUCE-like [Magnolia sinica]